MTVRALVSAGFTLLAVAAAGCLSRTRGELGHATFTYVECPFGCAVADAQLAAGGAHAIIQVQLAAGFSFTQTRSTAPSVATFGIDTTSGGSMVDVTSAAPGTARLQLVDANGTLVDEVAVTVAAVAQLGVKDGWSGAEPLVLDGATERFHVTTEDAASHTLVGSGAVRFEVAPPLHAVDGDGGDDAQSFAGTPGHGVITARAGSASAVLPVDVVPAAAITGVTATVKPGSAGEDEVDVVATTASGPVYGATCAWSVGDPALVVASQVASSLDSAPLAKTMFRLARAGSFVAHCAVGAASTTVQLSR